MAARKHSPMEKWGATAFIIIAVVYGYLHYFRDQMVNDYSKAVRDNNALVKTVSDLGQSSPTAQGIEESIRRLRTQLDTMKKSYDQVLEESLAPQGRIEEMVMKVSEIAANNGLRVSSMAPIQEGRARLFAKTQSEQKVLGRTLYQLQVAGSFPNLYEFFTELTSLPSMVCVTNVNIQRNQVDSNVSAEIVFII